MYAACYGLGADRADITASHQTFHLCQALIGKEETRQPKDFAPQFENGRELNEAESIMAEIRSSI